MADLGLWSPRSQNRDRGHPATVLENETNLVERNPLVLGSMELPGGTRRLEIAVVTEAVKERMELDAEAIECPL